MAIASMVLLSNGERIMKVFIVLEKNYEASYIAGVFTKQEVADTFAKELKSKAPQELDTQDSDYYVHEYEVFDSLVDQKRSILNGMIENQKNIIDLGFQDHAEKVEHDILALRADIESIKSE